jgi:hypothetical protein
MTYDRTPHYTPPSGEPAERDGWNAWGQRPDTPYPPAAEHRQEQAPEPRRQWQDPAPEPRRQWQDPTPEPRRQWQDPTPAPAPGRQWQDPAPEPTRQWQDPAPEPTRQWQDPAPEPRRQWQDLAPAPSQEAPDATPSYYGAQDTSPVAGTDWGRLARKPTPQDVMRASVRSNVAHGLRAMNGKRAHQALSSLSTNRPLSAHGVCLFYSQFDDRQALGVKVYTVARWSFQDALNSDLPRFLSELTSTVSRFATTGGSTRRRWDPRDTNKSLVNMGDLDMPRDTTTYVGLGVETLDTTDKSWAERGSLLRNSGNYMMKLPGEAVALLTDGSILRVVRDVDLPLGVDGTSCTHPLNADRPLHTTRDVVRQLGTPLASAWPQINELGTVLQRYYSE